VVNGLLRVVAGTTSIPWGRERAQPAWAKGMFLIDHQSGVIQSLAAAEFLFCPATRPIRPPKLDGEEQCLDLRALCITEIASIGSFGCVGSVGGIGNVESFRGVFVAFACQVSFDITRDNTDHLPYDSSSTKRPSSSTDSTRKPTAHAPIAAASSLLIDPATATNIMAIPSDIRAIYRVRFRSAEDRTKSANMAYPPTDVSLAVRSLLYDSSQT
jgi:hypothetical protein